jgi:hypothetical protein
VKHTTGWWKNSGKTLIISTDFVKTLSHAVFSFPGDQIAFN